MDNPEKSRRRMNNPKRTKRAIENGKSRENQGQTRMDNTEKTKGAVKNRQPKVAVKNYRSTCNIGHMAKNEDKEYTKHTTLKINKMSNADTTLNQRDLKEKVLKRGAREWQTIAVSFKTIVVLFRFKQVTTLSVIEERTKYQREKEEIRCYLRNVYFVTINQFVLTNIEIL